MENAFSATLYAEATSWLGTPFRHNMQKKATGADCLGFVLGVFRNCGVEIDWSISRYSPVWYREKRDEQFLNELTKCMDDYKGGSYAVSLFRLKQDLPANHIGLWFRRGENERLFHAHSRHGVICDYASDSWMRREVKKFTKEK